MDSPRTPPRKTLRIEVVQMVRGETDDGHWVVVVNASEGGLAVRSNRRFDVDAVHEFRFRTESDPATALVFHARVRHVEPLRDSAEHVTYVAGLQFLEPRTEQQRIAIDRLLRACVLGDPDSDAD